MKTKILKKVQRHINRSIRTLNNGIKEDTALKGRFSAKQIDRKTILYHDGSGFNLLSLIQLEDNETGLTKIVTIEVFPFSVDYRTFFAVQLLVEMNAFMLQDCHFTEE